MQGTQQCSQKKGAAIYDDHTTTITANQPPILEADRCNLTSLWKLPLHPEGIAANGEPPQDEAINVIFDLPSAHQNFLWYHTEAGFPPKETFIRAVHNGNYATWPKLTVQLIHKYMPDSDETAKEHLKGQRQGVRSTKQKAFENMIEVGEARKKIEGESSPFHPLPPTKLNDILVRVEDLNEEIHTNQTGAFPHTSQRGNHHIMVTIHLDTNYIFPEPMKNRTEGEMIRVYQKIRIHKKISGLEKKAKKVPRVFFQNWCSGTKTKVRSGCRLSPLSANVVDSLLIRNGPPWHLSLVISTSCARFWLHSGTGATLARATVKPESRFLHFPR
jgi:hypothetical protein